MKLQGTPAEKPATKPAVEAALILVVDGLPYEVEILPPTPDGWRRFSVRRQYTYRYRYEVEEKAPGGYHCSCPGWKYAGQCKHGQGLKAVGLLGAAAR